jgi:hypothetical protein
VSKRRSSYHRGRIFTGKGRGHVSRPQSWRVLIKEMCHEQIYLLLSQSCANEKCLSDHISRSSIVEVKIEHLTSNRFMAQIGKSRAVVGQFLPMAKGVDPPKGKFPHIVTCPKTSGVKFSYPLDQSGQVRCHLRFSSLLIDKRGGGGGVSLPLPPSRL